MHKLATDTMTEIQGLLRRVGDFVTHDTQGLSRSVRDAALMVAVAWTAMIIGGTLTCFALVYALAALLPTMPQWALFGVVGLATLMAGFLLLAGARARMSSFQPVYENSVEIANDAGQVIEHVNEVIETTKDSINKKAEYVQATVESIKNATDLNYQVEQRPWMMFAGAAGLGYVGGTVLYGASAKPLHPRSAQSGNGLGAIHQTNGTAATSIAPESGETQEKEPGIFSKLGEVLVPQAELIQGIAIGALFSLARDWASDLVPKPLEEPVGNFFNNATTKFGGKPMAPGQFKAYAAKVSSKDLRPPT